MDELIKEILFELRKNNNIVKDNKLTYSLKECSAISGIGLNTLQQEINKNNSDFPFFRIGKKIMVNKQLFNEWIENISKDHKELRV